MGLLNILKRKKNGGMRQSYHIAHSVSSQECQLLYDSIFVDKCLFHKLEYLIVMQLNDGIFNNMNF